MSNLRPVSGAGTDPAILMCGREARTSRDEAPGSGNLLVFMGRRRAELTAGKRAAGILGGPRNNKHFIRQELRDLFWDSSLLDFDPTTQPDYFPRT